jgi:hypothetical protein
MTLPYDPAKHPKEYKSTYKRGICTPSFIAALFTVAKPSNQPSWMDKENVIQHEVLFSYKEE